MAKLVTLTIDDTEVTVPEGTLIVDAAKRAGFDIPVFCYHPKMEPVGMCRMCLVEVGRPVLDRTTGEPLREADGSVRLQFGPKLETACTTPVSQGMVVRQQTDKVQSARKEVVEFILTSHPLDCPICDKGGECPLQNLTMQFGPGQSRFLFDEKMRLAKHVPLGELIWLDRERCIQCGRCVRFQSELAQDPVLGFYQRGRSLEIVTCSEPGFDSYFSGNTTDICPVGALTTSDFRFGARPWELKAAAGICNHCPVGCNLTYNVRREAKSQGKVVIKRVMPRQNEAVNEIWICDKGRFGYHYAESPQRLRQPLVRVDGELRPATWETALSKAAGALRDAGERLLTLAGGRLTNEDLFNLKTLTEQIGGQAVLYERMAGGELIRQVGVGKGTNFSDLGKGSAILVVACDLEEEAPLWWLRVSQAVRRGATLIVLNPRPTKLDSSAAFSLRYPYTCEVQAISAFMTGLNPPAWLNPAGVETLRAAAKAFADSQNAIIIYGSEGLDLAASQDVAEACAHLLSLTNHIGRANNGLLAAWAHANTQGAFDMGLAPTLDLAAQLSGAAVAYIAGANPAADDKELEKALARAGFVVVQDLFLTETAKKADVVLPVAAAVEREGTYTNAERRVQRFYPATFTGGELKPDFVITARLGEYVGLHLEGRSASLVMQRIAALIPDYAAITYQALAEVTTQYPIMGRHDLYYGGTSYENSQGLGVQLEPAAQKDHAFALGRSQAPERSAPNLSPGMLLAVPVTLLYDRGELLLPTELLHGRIPAPYVAVNPQEAAVSAVEDGAAVLVDLDGTLYHAALRLDESIPVGVMLVPRSLGLPIPAATPARLIVPTLERTGSE